MVRYTASLARQHLSDLLDAAAQGEAVVIERRGVRFDLRVAPERKRARVRRKPRILIKDRAVAEGRWTWAWGDVRARAVTIQVARHSAKVVSLEDVIASKGSRRPPKEDLRAERLDHNASCSSDSTRPVSTT